MSLLIDANNSKTTQAEDDPGTGNQKIVSKSFTDLDNFKEFFDYQNKEIIQLSAGPLQAEFLSVQIGNLYFVCNQANQGIQFFGDGTKGYISFGILWSENEKEYYSFRHPLEPQRTIFGFNNREADHIFPQGLTVTHIIIPVKTFDAYADQLQRQDLDDKFRSKNHVNLLPTGMNEIKDYLKELVCLALHKPNWLQKPHIEKLVADDLIPLLISNIPTKCNSKCFIKPSRRAKLIVQAEKKMLAHLEKPLTLKQLAQNLGSSSSALSYGFQDLFGLSPMRYLKVRRLNAVRERLKASEPERCTIAIVASEFGFYSPCHFTRDYKAMFGELPSETLRNTGN
ncbi:AraC family transcriptional regulator [Moorena producens JHB]|uniref:AraC family transcriptional regulator n=1 Tax=Moorena producens (strain JHB) TaxID=1454205 RepID=A0A1D9GAX5_MOOP1|nr:AraC family transcriptional regulator [Moorena producens]AOY84802.2 AraC family transcriptional regulator [Moorena producens JHB]